MSSGAGVSGVKPQQAVVSGQWEVEGPDGEWRVVENKKAPKAAAASVALEDINNMWSNEPVSAFARQLALRQCECLECTHVLQVVRSNQVCLCVLCKPKINRPVLK